MSASVKELLRRGARFLAVFSDRSELFGRFFMADLAARYVGLAGLEGGAFLEFGVFRGTSFARFHHAFRRHRLSVPMWAFDSFAGLPESVTDAAGFRAGMFACSRQDFESEVSCRGVSQEAYHVVEGFFSKSLTEAVASEIGKVAVVHLDCDIYESTRDALRFCGPLLMDGTLLIFDEFYAFGGSVVHGERRAFEEFVATKPGWEAIDYAKFGALGQAFILSLQRSDA